MNKNFARTCFWVGTVALMVLSLFGSVVPAQADIAPPEPPPGSNPGPGAELTQVQMVTETVVIDVYTLNPSTPPYYSNEVVEAEVTALFTMRNQGTTAETMQVRFPLSNPSGYGDGDGDHPELTDLTAAVNQTAVPTTRITLPNPLGNEAPPVAWAAFEVTFPPGQDVLVEVKYTLSAMGYVPYASFQYVLETGAGWQGPIGVADIILQLPYPASAHWVILDITTGWSTTTPGVQFVGQEARWHFENLEPTYKENIEVSLIAPYYWKAVVEAQAVVAAQPENGDAWGALARAYKGVSTISKGWPREDAGGREIYQLSVAAYEKALALAPESSRWHSGYAELLWQPIYWEGTQDYAQLTRIAQLLQTALALDPANEQAQELLERISDNLPEIISETETGQWVYLILTATPTAVPPTDLPTVTQGPSPVPSASATAIVVPATATAKPPQPTALPAATVTQVPPQTSTPFCGGAAGLILFSFIGVINIKRRYHP